MPFITDGTNVISFAEASDVLEADQRLFEANEGLTDDVIDPILARSTRRILHLIKNTDWWFDLNNRIGGGNYGNKAQLPEVDPNKIIYSQDDFTDLCVMYALWNYILPKIADFSKEDNAERAKIGFYQGKYQFLFDELINSGDWYDLQGGGSVTAAEKFPGNYVLKRVR
jgi:hypothetical protein